MLFAKTYYYACGSERVNPNVELLAWPKIFEVLYIIRKTLLAHDHILDTSNLCQYHAKFYLFTYLFIYLLTHHTIYRIVSDVFANDET